MMREEMHHFKNLLKKDYPSIDKKVHINLAFILLFETNRSRNNQSD